MIDITNHSKINKSIDELNSFLERQHNKINLFKSILLNSKELYSIIPGVYFDKCFLYHNVKLEKLEFEYNFNNEYKVFINELFAGYLFFYPEVDHNHAFQEIEEYFYKNCLEKTFFNEEELLLEIQNRHNMAEILIPKLELLDPKIPFYRDLEFKNKKKGFRCLKH